MIKFIGILTIVLLISSVLFWLTTVTHSQFIDTVLEKEILTIVATIFGLNLVTVTFLLGKIQEFEIKIDKKDHYSAVKKELKENLLLILCIFLFLLVFLLIGDQTGLKFSTEIRGIILIGGLLLCSYALYETIAGIFVFDKFLGGLKDK